MPRTLSRVLWLAIGLVGGACTELAAAGNERWVKLVAPEFTVITPLREADAVEWAGEFAQYVATLHSLYRADPRRLSPLTFVVFRTARDFQRYRPLAENGKPQLVDGLFMRHESWAVAGMGGARLSEELRRTIFHEGVHWFLSSMERRNPVWLEEGIAEVFSTFAIAKKQAEWGRPVEHHIALLRNERPVPLDQLMYTARQDLFGDDSVRTSLVYAQSWAFVHYLLFGKHALSKTVLSDYFRAVQGDATHEEAFRKAFGGTYQQLDRALEDYLHSGLYFVRRSDLVTVAAPRLEPASVADVAIAQGRLAFAAQLWSEAGDLARRAMDAEPDDPRGHELLGLTQKAQGNTAAALAAFRVAIEKGTRDFQPYFEIASAAQNDAFNPAGRGSLDAAEARRIANQYQRAINLHPRFAPAYQNLAGIVGIMEPWGPEDRKFLELGLKLFPENAMIRIGLAVLTHRAGDVAAAKADLAAILGNPNIISSARAYARRLEDAWMAGDVLAEIARFTEARQPAEALALIEKTLNDGVGSELRQQLTGLKRQLVLTEQVNALQAALANRRWTEARRIIDEGLASSTTPASLRIQLQRALADLDRRKLGLPADRK